MKHKFLIVLTVIIIIVIVLLIVIFAKKTETTPLSNSNLTSESLNPEAYASQAENTGKKENLSASFALDPSSGSFSVGQTFEMAIKIDTGNLLTTGADAIISYSSSDLEAVSIQTGTVFQNYPGKVIDTANGKISISGTINPGGDGYNGNGVFATITFKALRSVNSTAVKFDFTQNKTTDSNVASKNNPGQDILGKVTDANFKIN
jgi:hypothetical protein